MFKKVFFVSLLYAAFLFPAKTFADVSTWQKSATIVPQSQTDFSSASFKKSLDNLKATGANDVTLVIPYYQSNLYSTDIQRGWNTPTDQSLTDAMNYAKSIGLAVTLKPHLDPYTNEWRAYINPSDRNTWYANYGNMLNHYADMAKTNGAGQIIVGAELYKMAAETQNPDNTQRWKTMISAVRQRFGGSLSYSANHTGPTEENEIKFWDALDKIGVSAYFPLAAGNSNPSVTDLKNSWASWDSQILQPLTQAWNKLLIFTEIGYRNTNDVHSQPFAWWLNNGTNQQEQANDYEALFSYWNSRPYFTGVHLWDWSSNPDAGKDGSVDYTPQNKLAQQTMINWFGQGGGGTTPTPSPSGTITPTPSAGSVSSSATTVPVSPAINQTSTVAVTVKTANNINNAVVDVEIYNSQGGRVFQNFWENQNLSANQNNNFSAQYTPTNIGTYTIKIGVFNQNWSGLINWNDNAGSFTVANANVTPTPTPTTVPSITPTPTTVPSVTPTPTGAPSPTPTTTPQPTPTNAPPATININIWWPSNGGTVSGVQPFKANVDNMDISQYDMFWQVDGGSLNGMGDSTTDYPHKEALVDVGPWTWNSNSQYTIKFIVKDKSGKQLGEKSITINVTH